MYRTYFIQRRSNSNRSSISIKQVFTTNMILLAVAWLILPLLIGYRGKAEKLIGIVKIRSIGQAMAMYAADYDDRWVIVANTHSSDTDSDRRQPGAWYMPWTGLIATYLGNLETLNSPITGTTSAFRDGNDYCTNERQCALLYPTYGYNPLLSLDSECQINPVTSNQLFDSSRQVLFTEIWSRNYTSLRVDIGLSYSSFGTAEPPYGNCANRGWGNYSEIMNGALGKKSEGMYRAGVAFRHEGNKTPTAFDDTHVKTLTAAALAAGSDWKDEVTVRAVSSSNGAYMWNR